MGLGLVRSRLKGFYYEGADNGSIITTANRFGVNDDDGATVSDTVMPFQSITTPPPSTLLRRRKSRNNSLGWVICWEANVALGKYLCGIWRCKVQLAVPINLFPLRVIRCEIMTMCHVLNNYDIIATHQVRALKKTNTNQPW